jgi:hypothetical protein
VPIDTQLAADLLLADLPLTTLHELQDDDRPAHRDRTEHDPNAALLFPLPSPVLTSSNELARAKPPGGVFGQQGVTHSSGA